MLNAYVAAVQTLLHDPNAQFFPVSTLTSFINEARQQIALEGECIRGFGSLTTALNQQLYFNTTGITSPAQPAGIASPGLIVPRSLVFNPNLGGGSTVLEKRAWDWFNFYWLGLAAPPPGPPAAWAPFQIGSDGSFYLAPNPNALYSIQIDGAWSPINLTADADPEAIPYPWTDAVQFYATYLANLDSQRRQDADEMFQRYEEYMARARGIVTPLVAQDAYPGGLAARTPRMAPPTPADLGGGGRQQ